MRVDTRALTIARTTIAATAAATMIAIAACSEKTITSPPGSPRNATTSSGTLGHGNGFAATVRVCVDASSPAGIYKFRNSSWNSGIALTGYGSYSDPSIDYDPGPGVLMGDGFWHDAGDGGIGFHPYDGSVVFSPAEGDNSEYIVGVGSCVTVLERTLYSVHYNGVDPIWNFGPTNTDDFQSINVTVSTIPSGVAYDHTDCVADIGVVPPQPFPCGNTSQTVRAFANYDHGTQVTYTFVDSPETPCPGGEFTSSIDGSGNLNIKFDQFPAPNDNSYGVNAVGWPNGHTFGNLTGSDKAGVQLKDENGVVRLSFNMDYLSANTSFPSGYGSLGVTGGDGDMVVGTADGITVTTSLANNLNNINIPGLFNPVTHVQLIGSVNVLVNSPPTDPAHLTYNISDPALAGWDFHDTYYATISAAKLASIGFDPATWTVEPNLTVLHNSPAKPCPPSPFSCADITVGNKTFGSKEVKVDVNNNAQDQDAFVTGVAITWPVGTNGALKTIKIGGDVIWSGTNTTGNVNFTLADLVANAGKRKIGKHSDEDIKFQFANNVSTTLADYTGTVSFGDDCTKTILP